MKRKKTFNKKYAWVIAQIDNTELLNKDGSSKVQKELKKFPEYKNVEVFIPTIRVISKTFKKENKFEEVPLLFNYGFFKIPRDLAIYKSFLENMQRNISCIFCWVKDNAKKIINPDNIIIVQDDETKTLSRKKPKLKDKHVPVATATPDEIAWLVKESYTLTAHSAEELNRLGEGAFITLRGYPWEGVNAVIVDINEKKRKVKVNIEIFGAQKEMEVEFDNVFFSTYQRKNYDDSLSTLSSIEQMDEKNTLDKALFKNNPQYENYR